LKQVIVDAGPLIGLFYAKDTHHTECVSGFRQLAEENIKAIAPVPIVFEVYKWLLQRTRPQVAQRAIAVMEKSLYIVLLSSEDFDSVRALVAALPNWQGTLEDATIAVFAKRIRCPVWTLNYRDFSAFADVEFWQPEGDR